MTSCAAERVALGVAAISVALLGFEWLEPSGSLGVTRDLRLTDVRLALILTLVCWLGAVALARRWPRRPSSIGLPLAAWLVVLLVSALLAPIYQTQALAFVRDMLLGVVFGWAVYDLARTPSRQVLLARALAVSGMGVACFGLAEASGRRRCRGLAAELPLSGCLQRRRRHARQRDTAPSKHRRHAARPVSSAPARLAGVDALDLGARGTCARRGGSADRAGADGQPSRHRRHRAGAGRHAGRRQLATPGAAAAHDARGRGRIRRCWSGSPSPASPCCSCT